MKLTCEELQRALVRMHGYPPPGAAIVATKLLNLVPPLDVEFLAWWESPHTLPTISVEGITAASLMADRGLKPIAAILTMDWLLRDPKSAREALARGADSIRPH